MNELLSKSGLIELEAARSAAVACSDAHRSSVLSGLQIAVQTCLGERHVSVVAVSDDEATPYRMPMQRVPRSWMTTPRCQ